MTFLQYIKKILLPDIANRIKRSVILNFKFEGRPNKWIKSKRAILNHGKTLTDTATLRNSINYKIKNLSVFVGTNVIYAKAHQFGLNINKSVTVKKHKRSIKKAFGKVLKHIKNIFVKSHKRKINIHIKKRPFLLLQISDIKYIKNKINSIWSNYENQNH